jgi:hypothetical protein
MAATVPGKSRKILFRSGMAAFMLGALCAFGGAIMAFNHNGPGAIKFALAMLIFYVVGSIFYTQARKRPQADKPPERVS